MSLRKISPIVLALVVLFSGAPASAAVLTASALTPPTGISGISQGYLPAFSCTSQGNCLSAGSGPSSNGTVSGFTFTQNNGTWGSGALIKIADASASQISVTGGSCGAAGSCTVTGTYGVNNTSQEVFVATEFKGTWRTANQLGLPAGAMGAGQNAQVHSISCVGSGSCSLIGSYLASTGHNKILGFTANEVNGVWGKATSVALPPHPNLNPEMSLNQISCWSAGNCLAVGDYVNSDGITQAFTVKEVVGLWGAPVMVTPPTNASAYAGTTLSEVDCFSVGSCTAIGSFNNATGALVPLAISMVGNQWRPAAAIALPPNASTSSETFLWGFSGISCASSGNCAFGGDYLTSGKLHQGFLVNEVNGVWQAATQLALPTGALYAGQNGGVIEMSCSAAGTCTAAGAYVNASGNYEGLLVTETQNHWQTATTITLPAGATTVGIDGGVYGLQCFSATMCEAVGTYETSSGAYLPFSVTS